MFLPGVKWQLKHSLENRNIILSLVPDENETRQEPFLKKNSACLCASLFSALLGQQVATPCAPITQPGH